MAFNWSTAIGIAAVGLAEAANLAPTLGTTDHQTAANEALDAAMQTAQITLTDQTQQNEATLSYKAAQSIINLVFAFTKSKK